MTDTVEVVDEDWPRLRVVSVAPLIGSDAPSSPAQRRGRSA
jgi:hypothetical protein